MNLLPRTALLGIAFSSIPALVLAQDAPSAVPGSLTGSVQWNEVGVGDVQVRLCGVQPHATRGGVLTGCTVDRRTRSGEDGTYVVDSLPPGDYVVMAESDGRWVFISSSTAPNVIIGGAWIRAAPVRVSSAAVTTAGPIGISRSMELLEPVGGVEIDEPRPALRWAPIPGATRYRVSLFGGRQRSVGRASVSVRIVLEHEVPTTEYAVGQDLGNCTYFWWVEALNDAGTLLASSWNYYRTTERAPEDVGHFVVVGQGSTQHLRCS